MMYTLVPATGGQYNVIQFLRSDRRWHTTREIANKLNCSVKSVMINITKCQYNKWIEVQNVEIQKNRQRYSERIFRAKML